MSYPCCKLRWNSKKKNSRNVEPSVPWIFFSFHVNVYTTPVCSQLPPPPTPRHPYTPRSCPPPPHTHTHKYYKAILYPDYLLSLHTKRDIPHAPTKHTPNLFINLSCFPISYFFSMYLSYPVTSPPPQHTHTNNTPNQSHHPHTFPV